MKLRAPRTPRFALGLALVSCVAAAIAGAHGASATPVLSLEPRARREGTRETIHINGVPIEVRYRAIDRAPDVLARELERECEGAAHRIDGDGESYVLCAGDRARFAYVRGTGERALLVSIDGASIPPRGARDPIGIPHPRGASLVFSAEVDGGHRMVASRVARPLRELRGEMRRLLRAAGWETVAVARDRDVVMRARRAGRVVDLVLTGRDGTSECLAIEARGMR
jgi:hypothetical protein